MNDPKYYYLLSYIEFRIEQDKKTEEEDLK